MKKKFMVPAALAILVAAGCDETKSDYYDLNGKKDVELVKDDKTGRMVNKETGKPVEIYVDRNSNDTIYGLTGKVINNEVVLVDGKYKYGDLKIKQDDDFKIKDGDYKRKVDADGDIKIKDGDKTTKIDGETGEVKRKD